MIIVVELSSYGEPHWIAAPLYIICTKAGEQPIFPIKCHIETNLWITMATSNLQCYAELIFPNTVILKLFGLHLK